MTRERSSPEEPALRGDLSRPEAVDTASMDWSPSPVPTVLRKRLHRVGPAESGQVTSLVRYLPGARFPEHDHPEGEEILVLEGVFSDHRGDHGPGSLLLSPEGLRHAPWSVPGCVIFVKLRQYGGEGRATVAVDTGSIPWRPTSWEGVEEKGLHEDARFGDAWRLERWRAGARPGPRDLPGGAEVLVITGALEDERGRHGQGAWLRIPPGDRLDASALEPTVSFVKTGGVAGLRGAPPR